MKPRGEVLPLARQVSCSIFFPGSFQVLDTLHLARCWKAQTGADVENLKLETLAKYFSIAHDNAHDALADVRVNAKVARCLLEATGAVDGCWAKSGAEDEDPKTSPGIPHIYPAD